MKKRLAICASLAVTGSLAQADTLRDIYELSLRNDPTIRAAEANYKAGLEAEKIGRAGLLPQINATGGYNYSDTDNDAEFAIGSQIIDNSNQSQNKTTLWGLSLDQRIFDLPTWFSFTQGKELTRQATAQFAADQQDLIIRVADAYFEVLRAKDNLSASEAQERANQRQLDQTQQRFDVGLIAITDVHEARAAYDLSVATRLRDEGNLGVALERLAVFTGQRHDNLWLLKSDYPIIDPEPADKEEWVSFALDNNFNIKTTAYARDAAHEQAKAAKSEHAPKLSARLGYDESYNTTTREVPANSVAPPGSDNINTFPNDSSGPSVLLNLSIPLYSGGYISATRRRSYEQYNAAQENYAGVVRNTVQATRALHLQTTVDVATTKARRLAITSSQSAFDATEAGYEVGTRNIVDVLNVQQALYNAIRDYANARYDYVLDMLRLKNQAGTLSPRDIYELNKWLEPPKAPLLSNTGLTE